MPGRPVLTGGPARAPPVLPADFRHPQKLSTGQLLDLRTSRQPRPFGSTNHLARHDRTCRPVDHFCPPFSSDQSFGVNPFPSKVRFQVSCIGNPGVRPSFGGINSEVHRTSPHPVDNFSGVWTPVDNRAPSRASTKEFESTGHPRPDPHRGDAPPFIDVPGILRNSPHNGKWITALHKWVVGRHTAPVALAV